MSHLPEREEKACLNCGAAIHGRFCQVCGQENIEPKESFWHLVTHFVYDVTHFDGKFFSTLKYLLLKPGFLSHEYLRGRRASYLHPIRMYVFTSAFFFLIFFSLHKEEEVVKINKDEPTAAELIKKLEKKEKELKTSLKDTLPAIARIPLQKALDITEADLTLIKKDTTAKNRLKTVGRNSNNVNILNISTKDTTYKSVEAYDSIQKLLPASEKDNWIQRRFAKQNLHLKEKYNNDGKAILEAILSKFKHMFPQMLFVSLPLFALMLKLLYVRRRSFFYVNHVVYTIHLYCGTFIIILAGIFADYVVKLLQAKESGWVTGIFTLATMFFWYKSMRNFYEQRRAKTILKYILVFFMSCFIMVLLFTLFFIFSAMAI